MERQTGHDLLQGSHCRQFGPSLSGLKQFGLPGRQKAPKHDDSSTRRRAHPMQPPALCDGGVATAVANRRPPTRPNCSSVLQG